MADDTYVQAIRYEADIADVQKKLNDLASKQNETEGKTKDAAGKMSKHWDGVGKAVGAISVGIGALGAGALIMAPKILEGGAALEALDNKASTVFEGSLPMVNTWADANAKSMGLTSTQARDAAASIADLLKPMGFSADAAAGMSTDMVNLSGALSAWSGGQKSAADVSEIITSAMLGETDGLKGLGISITAADVAAKLAANGQDKLTGAALQQAQAQAVQQLIMEKSTDAQKAWSDGSMDAVKKQNTMKASIAGVQQSIIQALYPALESILPIVQSLAEWLGKNLPVAIEKVRAWFETNWPKIRDAVVPTLEGIQDFIVGFIGFVQGAWDTFGATIVQFAEDHFGAMVKVIQGVFEVISGIFQLFKDILTGKWGELWEDILKIFNGIKDMITGAIAGIWADIQLAVGLAWDGIKGLVGEKIDAIVGFVTGIPGRIVGTISTMWDGIKTGMTDAKDWVGTKIDEVVGFALNLPNRMWGIFTGMWDGIKDAFKSVINTIIGWWNNLDFTFPGFDIPGPGPNIPGFTIGLPDIPKLHSGGVVPGPSSREMLAILRGGETVRTEQQESSLSKPGKTINIAGDLVVHNPTGTSSGFVAAMWRVAG